MKEIQLKTFYIVGHHITTTNFLTSDTDEMILSQYLKIIKDRFQKEFREKTGNEVVLRKVEVYDSNPHIEFNTEVEGFKFHNGINMERDTIIYNGEAASGKRLIQIVYVDDEYVKIASKIADRINKNSVFENKNIFKYSMDDINCDKMVRYNTRYYGKNDGMTGDGVYITTKDFGKIMVDPDGGYCVYSKSKLRKGKVKTIEKEMLTMLIVDHEKHIHEYEKRSKSYLGEAKQILNKQRKALKENY